MTPVRDKNKILSSYNLVWFRSRDPKIRPIPLKIFQQNRILKVDLRSGGGQKICRKQPDVFGCFRLNQRLYLTLPNVAARNRAPGN